MKFSTAHQKLLAGAQIYRKGWNGPDQFIFLVPVSKVAIKDAHFKKAGIPVGTVVKPVLAIFNAQGEVQPGWVPSQGDLLADDWLVK